MPEPDGAYVPAPPSLLSAKRLLWALPLLALGVFAVARGDTVAGVALIAAALLVIPVVARLSRRGLFPSGDQVPATWEGPLPPEIAKTPVGLFTLVVVTTGFGLLCAAGAAGRIVSGV